MKSSAMLWTLTFACLISLPALGSRYDAYVLDHLITHLQTTLSLTELAEVNGKDFRLKREARKIHREAKHDLRDIVEYRDKEFEEVPSYWILPGDELAILKKVPPESFDLKFASLLIHHLQEGRKRLSDAVEKGSRGFVTSTAKKLREHFDKHLKKLQELKADL